MTIKTKDFQEACRKILAALDTDATARLSGDYDSLEIKAGGGSLNMAVSNGTYRVDVALEAEGEGELHAIVDGKVFLSLVAKLTTDSIELGIQGNSLCVKADGRYRFPLKYGEDENASLPDIGLGEVSAEFPIDGSVLLSIAEDNVKEINKKKATRPVQQMFYIDEEGCVTWTNFSACVNSFSLPKPIRVFVTAKVAKLFRLFHPGDVSFALGHAESGSVAQARVAFSQGSVSVKAIVPASEELAAGLPLKSLRGSASKDYGAWATFDVGEISRAIDRLSVFSKDSRSLGTASLDFSGGKATLSESLQGNSEELRVTGGEGFEGKGIRFAIDNLKSILAGLGEKEVRMNFDADGPMFVVTYGNIANVVAKVAPARG